MNDYFDIVGKDVIIYIMNMLPFNDFIKFRSLSKKLINFGEQKYILERNQYVRKLLKNYKIVKGKKLKKILTSMHIVGRSKLKTKKEMFNALKNMFPSEENDIVEDVVCVFCNKKYLQTNSLYPLCNDSIAPVCEACILYNNTLALYSITYAHYTSCGI